MKKTLALGTIAAALVLVGAVLPIAAQAATKTVKIEGVDQMRYTVTKIEAKAGSKLHIVLTTKSALPKSQMAHDFVILKPKYDNPGGIANFVLMASTARNNHYIPKRLAHEILASTDLAGNGETVETTFTVPSKPGSYTYFCTFPSHYNSGMKGTLVVTK
ncbi:MAG TPA: plastocyanin/azurin family copper-binding protein [Thermoanaerobaculia bacterium]|nr:plastocyanin/azurin family copper-binding protein [Thermoanaerobaculia bacterium]